jgi:hypothetical protein
LIAVSTPIAIPFSPTKFAITSFASIIYLQ